MSCEDALCVFAGNEEQKKKMNMSDEIELFHNVNVMSERDAYVYLQEYSLRFNWFKNKAKILDIGCGDGKVTKILSTFVPSDYEVLVGADINPKSVKFANDKYGNKMIKFVQLDIEGELPDNMKESFDHVFSFYAFHWIGDHQKAFTNIYNALQKNGEFFAIFITFSDVYVVFEILAKSKKWAQWMSNFNKFPSPYYDFEDPDVHVTKMLKNIGFNVLDVKCKQRVYNFESDDVMRGLVTAVNPFNVPKEMWPEFLDEYIETQRNMHLINETNNVKTRYNLLVIHCTK